MITSVPLLLQIFLAPHIGFLIDSIGQLRLETYKDYPYFYCGTLELEREYLQSYNESEHGMVVQAQIDGQLAGILTGKSLCSFSEAAQIFKEEGYNPQEYYYFGEIIMLPVFLHKEIELQLFKTLEQKVKELGYNKACFMIIQEEENHPLKPHNYEDPEIVYKHLGYTKMNIVIPHDWPTIQQDGIIKNSTHDMVFWEKQLD